MRPLFEVGMLLIVHYYLCILLEVEIVIEELYIGFRCNICILIVLLLVFYMHLLETAFDNSISKCKSEKVHDRYKHVLSSSGCSMFLIRDLCDPAFTYK